MCANCFHHWRGTLGVDSSIQPDARLAPIQRVGRYRIGERLGSGGFGAVYRAYDAEREADVALKLLHTGSRDQAQRALGEFRALRDLVHPNLVRLYELWATDELWFFTMELVEGPEFTHFASGGVSGGAELPSAVSQVLTLITTTRQQPVETGAHLLKAGATPAQRPGPSTQAVEPEQLRRAFRQLAQGLRALHADGKLHRDIKPSNVLVSREGVVQLADFGSVTEAGRLQRGFEGTPAFTAPEQIRGEATCASDWYAVGAMLYEVLTGRLPFLGAHEQVLLNKQQFAPASPECSDPRLQPLVGLAMRLLSREADHRPGEREVLSALGGDAVPSSRGAVSSLPNIAAGNMLDAPEHFFGRVEELEKVQRWIGVGNRILCVQGDSGVGKSSLIREAERKLQAPGRIVATSRCRERELIPYQALGGVLYETLLADPDLLDALAPEQLQALAQLFPILHLAEPEATRQPNARQRAPQAIQRLLERVADVVWVIDDAQWADADSLSMIDDLVAASPVRLRLLVSMRPDPGEFSRWLGKRSDVEYLILGALSDAQALSLAMELVSSADGQHTTESLERAKHIARTSAGHPMFLRELASLDSNPRGSDLDGLLVARIRRLPAAARAVVQLLAITREPTRLSVVAEASGQTHAEVERCLATAEAQRLLRSTSSIDGVHAETYHDRVAVAALMGVGPEQLAQLHASLAAALLSTSRHDDGSVALHLAAAGQVQQATEYALMAAAKARTAMAFERELELLNLALRCGQLDAAARQALDLEMAEALTNCRRGVEAAEHFLRIAERSPEQARLRLQQRAAEQFLIAGYPERGLALLESVLRRLDRPLPNTPLGGLASLGLGRARLRLRGRRFEERRLDQLSERDLLRLDTLRTAAFGLGMVDNLRAAAYHTRQLELALELGEPHLVGRALAAEAIFAGSRWTRGRDAWECAMQAQRIAERAGTPLLRAWSEGAYAILGVLRGDVVESVPRLRAVELVFEAHTAGTSWELNSVRMFRGLGLRILGHYAELRTSTEAQLRDASRRSDRLLETTLLRAGSIRLLAADRPEQAQHELETSVWPDSSRGFHMQHFWALEARAELDMYNGAAGDALYRYRKELKMHRRSLNTAIEVIRALDLYLRGRLHLCKREVDAAHSLLPLRVLAARLSLAPMSYAKVWTALLRAGEAHLQGDRRSSAQRLRSARELSAAASLDWFHAVADLRLGQLEGGEAGEQRVRAACARARELGVEKPMRLADVFAPGFIELGQS